MKAGVVHRRPRDGPADHYTLVRPLHTKKGQVHGSPAVVRKTGDKPNGYRGPVSGRDTGERLTENQDRGSRLPRGTPAAGSQDHLLRCAK